MCRGIRYTRSARSTIGNSFSCSLVISFFFFFLRNCNANALHVFSACPESPDFNGELLLILAACSDNFKEPNKRCVHNTNYLMQFVRKSLAISLISCMLISSGYDAVMAYCG